MEQLLPEAGRKHFLRLRAIALALRVLRLRAIALALRVLRLRAIALALRVLRLRAIALALRVLRLSAIALALRVGLAFLTAAAYRPCASRAAAHEYLMMRTKEAGSKLAPPTSAPSISSFFIRAEILSGFTLPPYKMRSAYAAAGL